MSDQPIGINFTGNAVGTTPEQAGAVQAVAEAASAWALTLEAFARSLQGTPGITNSTISGCQIDMGKAPEVAEKFKPKRKRVRVRK